MQTKHKKRDKETYREKQKKIVDRDEEKENREQRK